MYTFLLQSTFIATNDTVEVKDTTLSNIKSTKDIATPFTVTEEDTTLTIMKSTTEIGSIIIYCQNNIIILYL